MKTMRTIKNNSTERVFQIGYGEHNKRVKYCKKTKQWFSYSMAGWYICSKQMVKFYLEAAKGVTC